MSGMDDECVREQIESDLRISCESMETMKFFSYESSDRQTRGISFFNFLDCMRIYNLLINLKPMEECTIKFAPAPSGMTERQRNSISIPSNQSSSSNQSEERDQFECIIKKLGIRTQFNHKVTKQIYDDFYNVYNTLEPDSINQLKFIIFRRIPELKSLMKVREILV